MVVSVGEPGGLFALDSAQGEFLWAMPFPYDVPEFHISRIDVETGKTYLNWDLVLKKEGDRQIVCFENTKSYWPMAYHPGQNSLFIPFHDSCLDVTANSTTSNGHGPRIAVPRPGIDASAFAGIAKVNMSTGRMQRIYTRRCRAMGPCWPRPEGCFLGRPESKVPGFGCRQRRDALGNDSGRDHSDEHHHLLGQRNAVRGGADGRWGRRHAASPAADRQHHASARTQRDLCICLAVIAANGTVRFQEGCKAALPDLADESEPATPSTSHRAGGQARAARIKFTISRQI